MVLFNRKKIISEKGRKLRSRNLLSSPAPVPFLGDPGQAEHSQVWAHSMPLGLCPDPGAFPRPRGSAQLSSAHGAARTRAHCLYSLKNLLDAAIPLS